MFVWFLSITTVIIINKDSVIRILMNPRYRALHPFMMSTKRRQSQISLIHTFVYRDYLFLSSIHT